MAIELIAKIAPKNDGFDGLVDAEQIIAPTVSALTISSGEITLSGGAGFRRHTITSETGTSDTLTKIKGGQSYEILRISPTSGHTITVSAGSDILMSADFLMNSDDDVLVLECKSQNIWREVSRSSNG